MEWISCDKCEGQGIIADVELDIECCGFPTSYGSCCGDGIPKPKQVLKQCGNCKATGLIPSK